MSKLAKKSENLLPLTKEDVPATIKMLREQLDVLKGDVDTETSLEIDFEGVNIKNITDINQLIEIKAIIRRKTEAFDIEIKELKLEEKLRPYSPSGKNQEAWFKILDKAILLIINKAEIEKREIAIKELSQYVSEEEKLKNSLEKIMKMANGKIN